MSRRVVTLVERRTRLARLPRDEANFLLSQARHLIDVVPAFERGTYRLTPRGFVGYLDGPAIRYEINPKIPWPNLRMLLALSPLASGGAAEPEGGLLAALAEEFAARLEEVARAGLVAGYGEISSVSTFLRGKLRTADQVRDAAVGAFPDRFHIDEPVFDLQTPWNRIPKATAVALLASEELPEAVKQRVAAAAAPLSVVADGPATEEEFAGATAEPRAAGYGPLLEVCRLILNGLTCAVPLGTGSGAFLIDLGSAFERYLSAALRARLALRPGWTVETHLPFSIGPTKLQPDILVRKEGVPWAVLDAKWKAATYEAADLHQVLAYGAVSGVDRVGLVYPGRHDDCAHFATPDGRVRVSLYRLRVVGTTDQIERSAARLARRVRRE